MQRQIFLIVFIFVLTTSAASAHAQPLPQETPEGSRLVIDAVLLQEANHSSDQELPTLQVIFTVLDQYGNPIQSPLIDKVEVALGDDPPQDAIYQVPNPDAMPMYTALLMDASGSMSSSIDDVRRAAIRSLGETPRSTYFMVFRFSDERTMALPEGKMMTQERTEAEEAIRQIEAGGNTCLYDSIITTIQDLRREVPHDAARRALIVFTDGIDLKILPSGARERCSTDELPAVVEEARDFGMRAGEVPVPIYTIGLCNDEPDSDPCTHMEEIIQDDTPMQVNPLDFLARETGGISATGTLQDINSSFDRIMDRLNSQWLAQVRAPARQGQNQATLEVYLDDSTTPLAATFSFVSGHDYRSEEAGPTISITSAPVPRFSDGEYELPLHIEHPDEIDQIIIIVEDVESNTRVESAQKTIDRRIIAEEVSDDGGEFPLRIDASGFEVGQQYAFVVYANDSTGQPLTIQSTNGIEEELDRHVIVHESDIAFSVTALPQIEQDRITLEIDLENEIDEDLRYSVAVFDIETDGLVGRLQGVLDGEEIIIHKYEHADILDYIQHASEPRQYNFTVEMWKDGSQSSQGFEASDTETIAPINFVSRVVGVLLSPWTFGISGLLVVAVVGYSLYLRWRQRRKPTPQPLLHNQLTEAQSDDIPKKSGESTQGQMVVRVRLIKTTQATQKNKEFTHMTPFTIGRGEQDKVRISGDKQISRAHIKISAAHGAFFVTDNSTNGTYINDQRLPAGQFSRPLTRCTQIRLGSHTLIELDPQ
jgi:hypothetical protein